VIERDDLTLDSLYNVAPDLSGRTPHQGNNQ
jgi:hypothetical protein